MPNLTSPNREDWEIIHLTPVQIKCPKRELRKHPKTQIDKIKKSIELHGFRNPLLLDEKLNIIAGAARLKASLDLNLKEIPCIIFKDLNSRQRRALRLIDLKSSEGSDWIQDALSLEVEGLFSEGFSNIDLGFDTAEIDRLFSSDEDSSSLLDKPLPATPIQPVSQVGDVWILGNHRLICGDSRRQQTIDQLFKGRKADLVFTDMPYNVKIQGNVTKSSGHDEFKMASGEMNKAEFLQFNQQTLNIQFEMLGPGGVAFNCMDWRNIHTTTNAASDAGFKHINTCIWVKTNGGMGSLYRSQHELVLVHQKPGGKIKNNVQLGKHGRNRTNIWEYAGANSFSKTRDQDLKDHPTVKPLELVKDAILDVSDREDIVFDPFGGSGTTILAAQHCGRIAYLCEIDPKYVDVSIRRFEEAFGIKAIHETSGLSFDELTLTRRNPPVAKRRRQRNTITYKEAA